jgi:hypothetical protein
LLHAAMLSIAVIGRAMADIAGIKHKSGVRQIGRLLSNDGLKVPELERQWAKPNLPLVSWNVTSGEQRAKILR